MRSLKHSNKTQHGPTVGKIQNGLKRDEDSDGSASSSANMTRKSLETPKTAFKLHEATSAASTNLGAAAAARPGKVSSNHRAELIWNPNVEYALKIKTDTHNYHPSGMSENMIVSKETSRIELVWKLRKLLKQTCRKYGKAPPILAFERWLIRGSLEKDNRNSSPGTGLSKFANYDPLLPPLGWIDKGLIDDLMRASFTKQEAAAVVKVLNDKNAEGLQKLKNSKQSSEVLVKRHKHTYDVKLEGMKRIYKIGHVHYEKLKHLFHKSGAESNGLQFDSLLYILLGRYQALSGHGFQAAVNEYSFKVLHDHLGVSFECFASPLNCHFGKFCSAFPDIDSGFGSLGSFFSLPTDGSLEGSFEANPPFVSEVMTAMASRIQQLLNCAQTANKPLSFVAVVPGWVNEPCWNMMKDSEYLRKFFLIAKNDHGFCDGAQHQRQDRFRESPFDTGIFVLQSDLGKTRWSINDSFENAFRESMAEGFPTEAARARRARAGRGMADLDGAGGVYKGKKRYRDTRAGVEARRKSERKKKRRSKYKGKEIVV